MRRLRYALAWAVPMLVGGTAVAAAQDAQPSPQPLAAVECTAEPLTYERLQQLIGSPVPGAEATVEASPAPVTLPEGEPADEATAAAVRETVLQLVACVNSGQLDSALGLYSDNLLASVFTGADFSAEDFTGAFVGQATPVAGEETVLYSFSEVVMTADGRAAVVVLGDDQAQEGPASEVLFYLVEQEGRWLIDATVESPEPDS